MDKAVAEYKKRRRERLDVKNNNRRYDSVEEYKRRREKRLEARMDAGVGWVFGALKKEGVDTKGMGVKEAFEAWNELNDKGGKKSSEKAPVSKKLAWSLYPALEKGYSYEESLIGGAEKFAKKHGVEDKLEEAIKSLKPGDVVYQTNLHGEKKATVPGFIQKMDTVMTGRSDECQKIYDAAIEKGKPVAKDIAEVSKELGTYMTGLEHCFKAGDSTSGKIDRKRAKNEKFCKERVEKGEMSEEEAEKIRNLSDEEILSGFGDVVRFTEMCEPDDTVKTVKGTVSAMEKRGYKCIELDNKWLPNEDGSPSEYKAVHLSFESPDGLTFEVQIHSEDSLKTKNINHELYNVSRDLKTEEKERTRLKKQMQDNAAALKEPKGILELKSFDRRKRE